MAAQIFDGELNFERDVAVVLSVSPHALQLENESLKEQLGARDRLIVERDAAIADRDTQIKKLASDLAVLQQAVKELLARRGGGQRVPEGQGLLFPGAALEAPKTEAPAVDNNEADDGTARKIRIN